MKDTGRLKAELHSDAALHLYPAPPSPVERRREQLFAFTEVDRAHLAMLAESEIVPRSVVASVLEEIERSRANGFEAATERPTPRGLFTAWEDHLTEAVGEAGGILQTGRSRNDINATINLLSLRRTWVAGGDAIATTVKAFHEAAKRWSEAAMPAYTNGQPATPISLGHWCAACGLALGRDLDDWRTRGQVGLVLCPLGAGAGGGTTLPIDVHRTATLLGFEQPVLNSVDAVASRDAALRLAASAVATATTVARAARSLSHWTSSEVGFLSLPDELSGASSSLPQKRNPFLLEHIAGTHGAVLGAYVAAMSAAAAAPFGNSIAVGTEAVGALPAGFEAMLKAVNLTRLVVAGLRVNRARMEATASASFTTASALAERIVSETGMPFRAAHRLVGELISELELDGDSLADQTGLEIAPGVLIDASDTDPVSVLAAVQSRGGPNATTLAASVQQLDTSMGEWERAAVVATERWADASARLDAAVGAIVGFAADRTEARR
jgi:argininosuccinate lyase